MFRMCGNVVELYRYKIEYKETELQLTENNTMQEQTVTRTEYCISDEHRDEFIKLLGDKKCEVTPIDQTGNDWIDGMEFDSWDDAEQALAMGEEAYIEKKNVPTDAELALLAVADIYEKLGGQANG